MQRQITKTKIRELKIKYPKIALRFWLTFWLSVFNYLFKLPWDNLFKDKNYAFYVQLHVEGYINFEGIQFMLLI